MKNALKDKPMTCTCVVEATYRKTMLNVCGLLLLLISADTSYGRKSRDRNINPFPPTIAAAQMVIAANGPVSLSTTQLPFPNIFINGNNFLRRELGFKSKDIARQRRVG